MGKCYNCKYLTTKVLFDKNKTKLIEISENYFQTIGEKGRWEQYCRKKETIIEKLFEDKRCKYYEGLMYYEGRF